MSPHRPSRPTTRWVVALLAACLLVGVGATASAVPVKRLTEARVKKIAEKVASKVVARRASSLSVARAATADSLAGAGPSAYLDRVAVGSMGTEMVLGAGKSEILPAVSIDVPAGVSFVRVTATAGFSGSGNSSLFVVPAATPCDLLANDLISRPYLYLSGSRGQLVNDTVVRVAPGARSFHVCAATETDTVRVGFRTLVLETVAGGASGGSTP